MRYETGAILQFRPTEDRPTFGLLLDTQEDQVRIRWVYEQKDIDKTLLQSLRTTYSIQLQDHELFLSNKLSLQPIKDVLRKATVLLIDHEQEKPEPETDQYCIRFHYYIPAPHPSTWTVEEVSENMRALDCPAAAADLMVEGLVNGYLLTSPDFDQFWTMETIRGGLGLTTTLAKRLITELEFVKTTTEMFHRDKLDRTGVECFRPITKTYLDSEDKPERTQDRTDDTKQHQTTPSHEDISEVSPEVYGKDDFIEFLTPAGNLAIGKISSLYTNTMDIQWLYTKNEINKEYLNTIQQRHGVLLLTNEIFLAPNRGLTIPRGNVIRRTEVWCAGRCNGKWVADKRAFTMDAATDHFTRFGTLEENRDEEISLFPLTISNESPELLGEIAPQTSISDLHRVNSMGTTSSPIQIRLRRPNGTTWELNIQANTTAEELYIEAERATGFKQDLFYLESNGQRINELGTLHQHNLSQNPNVSIILRSRGGGDHISGSKKKKTQQDNGIRAFEEAAKNKRMEKAQQKEVAVGGPQGPADMSLLLARRDLLLREGVEKEKERLAATRLEHDRHSKEDAVQKDIDDTLATNDNLTPEGEEELRLAIAHTMNTLRLQRAPQKVINPTLLKWMMNKHLQRITVGTDRTVKMMQSWIMNPSARDSITITLRTRAENLRTDDGNSCPSEIDIGATFGPHIARKSRVMALPRDTHQDQNRRQGTDFQVDLEMAKHGITEMAKDGILTTKKWAFDMIVEPPGTEKVLIIATHQDNNQAKLLAFITGIRGFRDKGNEDTKIEIVLLQCLKDLWDKQNPSVSLEAVQVEHSRRANTKQGIQWLKPRTSALGVKSTEAPRIYLYLGKKDPSQSKEELQRAIKEMLRANNTITINMVADTDTSSDHTITFGIRPFNDKPESGTQEAINRAKDRLQTETQVFLDAVQKIEGILTELRLNQWSGSKEDARNILRSICGDLTDEDRPASSRTLGRTIIEALSDNIDPDALNDDETWRENIQQQRLVITVVSGITNFRSFFATNDFKPKISSHQNKHTAQMFCLRKALTQRLVETETVELIFEERRTSQPQNDTFVAVLTEKIWTNLIQQSPEGNPAILTPMPNTMARKLRNTEARDVLTIDGNLKILPGLIFKAVEETEVEDDEDEPNIQKLLNSGHAIFMPRLTDKGEEIHAGTTLKDITDPNWQALRIHSLDLKHPERILTYLHNLQERKRAQRLAIQKDVIIWMHPPLVDILLTVGREDLLKDLLTQNGKDTNHQIIVGTLQESIQKVLQQHADKGLWLQDTPFMDAIQGTASQDETTTPYPTIISELEAPAALPDNIYMLLRAPTTNKSQLLLDLTTQSIEVFVNHEKIVSIRKRGHTLLLRADSNILQAVIRSDKLRVGWPINFDTLEVSNEETEEALQQLLSLVDSKRGWGIVRLSVPSEAEHPHFDSTDYEPTQQLDNPSHISRSGNQILYLGRWIIDSPALKRLKLAKGILIFTTPQPKGILWIFPGKETPGNKEYRSLARLLGKGEETDRQVHTRIQETLTADFDTDTSLLAALDSKRMEILLEPMHPMVEGSPALLQDHHILKEKNSNQAKALIYRPEKRPLIGAHWNLETRWTISSDTEELIFTLAAAKSKGLLEDRYHIDTLEVPRIGTLILTTADRALVAKIPPATFIRRLTAAFQGPRVSMEELTGEETEEEQTYRIRGTEGPPAPK